MNIYKKARLHSSFDHNDNRTSKPEQRVSLNIFGRFEFVVSLPAREGVGGRLFDVETHIAMALWQGKAIKFIPFFKPCHEQH